jgi:phospholipase C
VLFVMYDENDGFFDHVAPPVPPRSATHEYLTANPLPWQAQGIDGPIGLGFRVPMLALSPFSTGGHIASEVFDHTSQLRFIESRWGVPVPNLTKWRRKTTGDLTSTLHMGHANRAVPKLPATTAKVLPAVLGDCGLDGTLTRSTGDSPQPLLHQAMPHQERKR